MQLIDTHTHLDEDAFGQDVAEVVARAESGGLVAMLAVATTAASSRATVDLAARFDRVFASVGIHPNYAAQAQPGDWELVEELVSSPKVVALGETGLDRYWDHTPFDIQIDYFRRHIELSQRTGLPFIVHCRDAEPDVIAVLRESANGVLNASRGSDSPTGLLNGVMHSFCGSAKTAQAALELGLFISFAGMLTFKKNEPLRQLAKTIPLDRLLVETDAPYLAPLPHRGKRNEPAFVRHTLECLADAYGKSADEMGTITTDNARRLFGLPV